MVTTFCEENNIRKTQFYYHKRKIEAANLLEYIYSTMKCENYFTSWIFKD